jgi:hypothetical protein
MFYPVTHPARRNAFRRGFLNGKQGVICGIIPNKNNGNAPSSAPKLSSLK